MAKPLRVPVLIDPDVYAEYKAYSELTGIPVSHVIREALQDFKDVSLKARIETFTDKETHQCAEVIAIDSFASMATA